MRNVGVAVASLLLSGCLESAVVTCEDGRICPPGLVCDDVHDACVLEEQLETCGTDPDGTPCDIDGEPGGFCQDGVCLRPRCGDGVRAPSEECEPAEDLTIDCTDLGYYEVSPLSCGADCKFDTGECTGGICGDGNVDDPEDCDELVPGTVVADCLDLDYYDPGDVACTTFCRFNDSGCTGSCGDGEMNGPELCDGAWESTDECADFGFDAGRIGCSESQCVALFDGCASIGWERIVTPATETIVAGWGSAPDDVWAIARQEIFHLVDGEWATVDPGFGVPSGLNTITGSGPDDVWVCGSPGVIWHWNGTTWIDESQGTSNIVTIAALAPDDVWAIRKQVGGNTLLHRDATGWTDLGSPGLSPTDLWAGDGAVWIGSSSGTVAEWNGSDWTFHSGLMTAAVTAIWGSSAHDVWFSGVDGTVLHHDGIGWEVGVIPGAALIDLWGSGPADIWAVSDLAFYHSDGRGFRPVDLPAPGEIATSGWSTGPGDTWYSGNSLYHSDGRAWGTTVLDPTAPAGFQQMVIAASATDDVWGVVPTGGFGYDLWRFDGWSWQPITAVAEPRGWVSGPGEAWFLGLDSIVHHDGTSVTPHPATGPFNQLWSSGPDDVWAAGTPTWRWDGTSFAPIPDDPDAPIAVWGFGPDDVWLGGLGGAVFHYDGATWTDRSVAGGATIASIWGAAPDDVWFAAAGTLFHWDGAAMTTIDLELGNLGISVIWGTAPDDVWAAGAGIVLHHDGVDWAPVRAPIPLNVGVVSISGTAREIYFGIGDDHALRLDRTVPWTCRAQETSCGDAVDDDCDGWIDGADPACATTVRLQELFSGDGGFVEVSNQTTGHADLTGLELVWQLACDAEPVHFRFPAGATAVAGASFRVVEGRDVGARERWLDGAICGDSTESGWALLCAGPCDLAACSNLVDVVAVQGTGALPPRPACASFAGAPIDVSGAGAGDSVTRTAFATSGSAAEWTIAPASRD